MIAHCSGCKPHDYQDRRYGPNMRVFTTAPEKNNKNRCTVCGKEKGGGEKK